MAAVKRIDKYELLSRGMFLQIMTPPQRIQALIDRLKPVTTRHSLIRIGADADGGYLIPDDLQGISVCFSPGVGPIASFEMDLKRRFGIGSHLSDYSVEAPPNGFSPLSFQKKFIGAFESDQFTTMDHWMDAQATEGDLLLQMDIEGGEYPAILALSERNLKRFRIIVAEFHHVEQWSDPAFFDIVEAVFTKLLAHHHAVHIHPNNHGGEVNMGGIEAPRVFEIAFLRRDRSPPTGFQKTFPHSLDRPCDPNRPELVLPKSWYARAEKVAGRVSDDVEIQPGPGQIFDNIYRRGLWGHDAAGNGTSGYGSHEARIIEPYVAGLRRLLKELGCSKIADLGCGDFNIGRQIAPHCSEYIACDVSEVILTRNRAAYRSDNVKFVKLNLAADELPHAELATVRQVLQHLSNAEIKSFTGRLNASKPYKYMLVTEHVPHGDFQSNADHITGNDIRIGTGSGVVLHEAPFNLVHKARKVLLEVEADTHGRKAVIRTTLYVF